MINVDLLYPVGSIYLSIKSKNPSEIFGGVWERIAKGRTLVGVDENDTDFSSSKKIGGEKEHILTVAEMPKHRHDMNYGDSLGGNGTGYAYSGTIGSGPAAMLYAGSNQPHNNLQPYLTCYIFVRTA